MKRLPAIALLLTLLLTACTVPSPSHVSDGARLSIVTTNFPGYDFARQIAGESAEISMLLPPGAESHSFEPTMQDIVMIQGCDIFFYVGGESEAWVDDILSSMDTTGMTILSMMDIIEPLREEWKEGMTDDQEHDDDHDHEEAEYDEHVWTSPLNAILLCKTLTDTLITLDAEQSSVYQDAYDSYAEALTELDTELRAAVAAAQRHTLVFGDRFPFRYLTEEYGLDYYAAFPGCASETAPSVQTMVYLIDKIREEQIPVVFYIEFSNGKIADTLCESTGARKLLLHTAHNVTRDELQSGVTYLMLMKQNIINLREAMG